MSELHEPMAIMPDALYSPAEVAWILGFRGKSVSSRLNRVYEIPGEQLPRVPVGPRGGKLMYLGRDILAYIESRRTSKPIKRRRSA